MTCMKYDDFIGKVMDELQIGNRAKGVRAVRATLTALGERLQEGDATDLASSLPMEIDFYVLNAEHGQSFGFDEFIDRVMEIDNTERPDAVYRAKLVMKTLGEAVPRGEIEDIMQGLPEEFDQLFELVEMEDE